MTDVTLGATNRNVEPRRASVGPDVQELYGGKVRRADVCQYFGREVHTLSVAQETAYKRHGVQGYSHSRVLDGADKVSEIRLSLSES
jgi:hypothetical protein